MTKVACIGECMIELRQAPGGLYSRGFGGDTLNTAVYLARLETRVDYLTALGDDALSEEMIAAWHAEGIGTRRVLRLPASQLSGMVAGVATQPAVLAFATAHAADEDEVLVGYSTVYPLVMIAKIVAVQIVLTAVR